MTRRNIWTAAASEARRRFGIEATGGVVPSKSAVAASLCQRSQKMIARCQAIFHRPLILKTRPGNSSCRLLRSCGWIALDNGNLFRSQTVKLINQRVNLCVRGGDLAFQRGLSLRRPHAGHESDRRLTCNLLSHMQQKVVIKLRTRHLYKSLLRDRMMPGFETGSGVQCA